MMRAILHGSDSERCQRDERVSHAHSSGTRRKTVTITSAVKLAKRKFASRQAASYKAPECCARKRRAPLRCT